MNHTPAPWTREDNLIVHQPTCSAPMIAIADIAVHPEMTLAEQDANANLIAAAPDMLKALQLLYDTGEDGSMYDYAKSKATAAINKAKGES